MAKKKNPYKNAKKTRLFNLKRTDVDFTWDSSEEYNVGNYPNIKMAESAKIKDMLACIEIGGFKLSEEQKEKTIAIFKGDIEPEDKFIVNGFVVCEDELYLDDPTTVAPAYAWSISNK